MNKKIWAVVILGIIAIAAAGGAIYLRQKTIQSKPQACIQEAKLCPDGSYVGRTGPNCEFAECPEAKSFSNSNGQYSFEYPTGWNVAINKYNNKNSLFGPGADSDSGLGGVEIFSGYSSIGQFLEGVAANFTNKTDVTVDGISGVKADYSGASDGEGVVLLKDGLIYNIYMNSQKPDDFSAFNQILSTFKFIK